MDKYEWIDCTCGDGDYAPNVHRITIIDGVTSHAPYATATVCEKCFNHVKTMCGLTDEDFEDGE